MNEYYIMKNELDTLEYLNSKVCNYILKNYADLSRAYGHNIVASLMKHLSVENLVLRNDHSKLLYIFS